MRRRHQQHTDCETRTELKMYPFGYAIVRRAQTVSRWQQIFEQKIKLSHRYVALPYDYAASHRRNTH